MNPQSGLLINYEKYYLFKYEYIVLKNNVYSTGITSDNWIK